MITEPYGTWDSTISAADVAAGGVRFSDLRNDGDTLYWVEQRPAQAGLSVLVRRSPDGSISDVTPSTLSVGTTVHEYGGAPYTVHDGTLVVSCRTDGSVWVIEGSAEPRLLCQETGLRFADLVIDPQRARVISVCEDHRNDRVNNSIVSIALDSGRVTTLVEGRDFFAAPRLSPDGRELCWLAWDFPAMPWEYTELWRARIPKDGRLGDSDAVIANRDESLVQPTWAPNGDLYVMSDRNNWWNLYRVDGSKLIAIFPIEEECAPPPWIFGRQSYTFLDERLVAVVSQRDAKATAHIIELPSGTSRSHDLDFTYVAASMATHKGTLVLIASGVASTTAVVRVAPQSGGHIVVRRASAAVIVAGLAAAPDLVRFSNRDAGETTAYLYRPRNPAVSGPHDSAPPLLVRAHGGPTAQCSVGFDLETQFWTSRGFAVLDVDYAGSCGYGRAERERLRGRWGVIDVADCIDGARFVAARGDADPLQLFITGGSAGGYVVLCALAFHPNAFAGGASYYGIADLRNLQLESHKFESGYNSFLLGTLDVDDPVYAERSPITHVGAIIDPLIVLQGNDDTVVQPSQAVAIIDALHSRGIECEAYFFDGEGHGFRRSENIVIALNAELAFYRQVLGVSLSA